MQKMSLPPLTFLHRPGADYTLQGDGASRTVLSPIYQTVDFISLVLSVCYTSATNGYVLSEVQICQSGMWSPFFKLAFYSKKLNHSFDKQENEFALVNIDELQSKKPAQAYRFRLTLHGEMEVHEVAVCLQEKERALAQNAATLPPEERLVKPANLFSQMCLSIAPTEQKRLCSPTALCMALNTLGAPCKPLEVAAAVYDQQADIFGNWTLNTAYASTRGLFACVARFNSLAQLADYISKDSLVLASIAYQKGELSNAAVPETPGHLVLLCGWKDGKIYVADPAAKQEEEVARFYEAEEFARAWLVRKHGVAYIVRKK